MNLHQMLQRARTEEDVKDAYIKALGLRSVFKGLVDIQTPEVWFEAKEASTPPLLMFAQLLVYVRAARKRGEAIPGFLCVIDREKAAVMATEHAMSIFKDKNIKWPKSGSKADKALAAAIAPYVESHYVVYEIEEYEEEFVKATKDAIREGRIIRTQITPDNLRQVFDRWVEMVGVELGVTSEADYAVLFFADIMHDGENAAMTNLPARLLYDGEKPVFLLHGETFDLASERGYYNFWKIYHRPPEKEYRHYLLERRDSLLPTDDQKFKGAYYTPLHIVDRAYDQLTATLGENWQSKYIVWDMCAGVGNLEAKHSNLRNVYMSTLDQEDVTIMRSNPAFAGAQIFQYDYLNDDITDFGEIDYSITGKLPQGLRKAIEAAREKKKDAKPILVLINPPYAEATGGGMAVALKGAANKAGVANTQFARTAMEAYGKASNDLYTQFLSRADREIPNAKIAVFSTLKYVSAPTLRRFREQWNALYLGGFILHNRAFEGMTGEFPIGFLIWDMAKAETLNGIGALVLDRYGNPIGEKYFPTNDDQHLLTDWIVRPRAEPIEVVPLKNAIVPATAKKDLRGTRWTAGGVAWLNAAGNDLQNAASKTMLFSSGYGSGRGLFVTAENLWKAAIVFSVRRLIKPTWLNDRDQFLQPNEPLTDEFKSDCLVWMLFNGSNLTAGADNLDWNGRKWSITNHFIPYTEAEVGVKGRFESDFMVRYMEEMDFSPEARAVLDEGRKLWAKYHASRFPKRIRDDLKLNRDDVGWYQIRQALEAYDDTKLTDFEPFRAAYNDLSDKLRPMVYELGFLPN